MLEILILSSIQGITEFIPVSSSSHLIIFSEFINFENQDLSIDVSLHIGSFIAVITYFYKDIRDFIFNKNLLFKIILSSVPVMIFGFFMIQSNFISQIRNIEIIGWTTLIFGILLFVSDKFKLEKNLKTDFSYKAALIIGLFQILSIIPGVSRSGITITAARLLNFKRFDSSKISFLLSIPTLGAVTIYGLKNIFTSESLNFSILNLVSIFFSFIFSYLTIKYFLRFVKKFSMNLFVCYRLILGIFLIYIAYLQN